MSQTLCSVEILPQIFISCHALTITVKDMYTHTHTRTHALSLSLSLSLFVLRHKCYLKINCIYVNVNTTLHNEQPIKTHECKACSWDLWLPCNSRSYSGTQKSHSLVPCYGLGRAGNVHLP